MSARIRAETSIRSVVIFSMDSPHGIAEEAQFLLMAWHDPTCGVGPVSLSVQGVEVTGERRRGLAHSSRLVVSFRIHPNSHRCLPELRTQRHRTPSMAKWTYGRQA